jgi:thiol-disulfide isomerase/thioredoxin
MSFRFVAVAALTILAPLAAPAQVAPRPTTGTPPPLSLPAQCVKSATDWRSAKLAPALADYRAATDSTRPAALARYSAAVSATADTVQTMATDCARQFNLATVPPAQLVDLVALYNLAHDTASVRRATDRLISDPGVSARLHGQALTLAINRELVRDPAYFGIIDAAEALMAQLDALPDSLDDIKLGAHRAMLGRYDYLDVADGLRHHATVVIALARTLHQPSDMTMGYSLLARSYADRLHPDSALAVLDAGEREIGATATKEFKDFRDRYALIGTPAAAIAATWWINPDTSGLVTPRPGRVTLIEFSAHWCGPCKNSYPGMRTLASRYAGQPFDGVLVTQLYGFIGARRDLTPAQELEADRAYFGKEHALTFPVAVNPPLAQKAGQPFAQPIPDTDYRVSGIPQIIIVDKRGIIRQIVTGWDQGNTERFSKYIDALLAERI